MAPPYEVVANVPYHITSPILHRFLGRAAAAGAARPDAPAGSGRADLGGARRHELPLGLRPVPRHGPDRVHGAARSLRAGARRSNRPWSRSVRCDPLGARPRLSPADEDDLWRLVQAGFRERRKKLHNVLSRQLPISGRGGGAGPGGGRDRRRSAAADPLRGRVAGAARSALGPLPGQAAAMTRLAWSGDRRAPDARPPPRRPVRPGQAEPDPGRGRPARATATTPSTRSWCRSRFGDALTVSRRAGRSHARTRSGSSGLAALRGDAGQPGPAGDRRDAGGRRSLTRPGRRRPRLRRSWPPGWSSASPWPRVWAEAAATRRRPSMPPWPCGTRRSPRPQAAAVAASLGSDVPFFLARGAALVTGRGEFVEPLPQLEGEPPAVLLVTPRAADLHGRGLRGIRRRHGCRGRRPAMTPRSHAAGGHCPSNDVSPADSVGLPRMRSGLAASGLLEVAADLAAANDLLPAARSIAPDLAEFMRRAGGAAGPSGRPVGLGADAVGAVPVAARSQEGRPDRASGQCWTARSRRSAPVEPFVAATSIAVRPDARRRRTAIRSRPLARANRPRTVHNGSATRCAARAVRRPASRTEGRRFSMSRKAVSTAGRARRDRSVQPGHRDRWLPVLLRPARAGSRDRAAARRHRGPGRAGAAQPGGRAGGGRHDDGRRRQDHHLPRGPGPLRRS